MAPLLSYVFVTTFSPGPNNISSAASGVNFGYRRTLSYLLGITAGFFAIMLLCGLLSELVARQIPKLQTALRIVGAGYLVYLAVTVLRSTDHGPGDGRPSAAFGRGLLLQAVNPKVILYGLTVYTGFLLPVVDSPVGIIVASLLLAVAAFLATSAWALFGAAINRFLKRRPIRLAFNLLMAALLLYSALSIAGVRLFPAGR